MTAHRGLWGGNVIENTHEAIGLAYRMGADIGEIDICRTMDGDYYLFHDGAEEKLFGVSVNFNEWTTDEVEERQLRNTLNGLSGKKTERLESFLHWLPEDKLLNIDRSWFYWESGFLDYLGKLGKSDQLLLKSPVRTELLDAMERSAVKFPYMPIVSTQEELDQVLERAGIHTIGVELIAAEDSDWGWRRETIDSIHMAGLFCFANSEILHAQRKLYAGIDDDKALFQSYESSWGVLLDRGIDIIQTDWPMFLAEYRDERYAPLHKMISKAWEPDRWPEFRGESGEWSPESIAIYGLQLDPDGSLPEKLIERLEVGRALAETLPESVLILSGGKVGTDWTESGKMREWLISRGVRQDRILEDPNARDTVENNEGILNILREQGLHRVCCVSGVDHLTRCALGLELASQRENYPVEISISGSGQSDPQAKSYEQFFILRTAIRSAGLSDWWEWACRER
ncbi:MAG: ElyC/SanA/YdcF family protein [Tissierellia bacterium]|nr:ElyC/SanA/YdcF family protein [Tissierellia bacterium]